MTHDEFIRMCKKGSQNLKEAYRNCRGSDFRAEYLRSCDEIDRCRIQVEHIFDNEAHSLPAFISGILWNDNGDPYGGNWPVMRAAGMPPLSNNAGGWESGKGRQAAQCGCQVTATDCDRKEVIWPCSTHCGILESIPEKYQVRTIELENMSPKMDGCVIVMISDPSRQYGNYAPYGSVMHRSVLTPRVFVFNAFGPDPSAPALDHGLAGVPWFESLRHTGRFEPPC